MSGAQMEMDDDACQCKWMWFDGLRRVGRDKTHAARRILTRPWKAYYASLEECYNRMLPDHDSISSTIMNSAAISDWFADNVAKSEVGIGKKTFVICASSGTDWTGKPNQRVALSSTLTRCCALLSRLVFTGEAQVLANVPMHA